MSDTSGEQPSGPEEQAAGSQATSTASFGIAGEQAAPNELAEPSPENASVAEPDGASDDGDRRPPTRYSPLEVVSVGVVLPESHARLVLREIGGERRLLTIPIGIPEANSIVIARERLSTPRPLTHELFVQTLVALGVTIETVRITAGEQRSFRAEIVLSGPNGSIVLDCRPSDGIALALRQPLPVPVTAAVALLDQLGSSSS